MTETRLAIVGSTTFARDAAAAGHAADYIEWALSRFKPVVVISGGADGIDKMAAAAARERGIPVREHLPKNPRWEPDGYKARNITIAEDCTRLLAIRHPASTTYGSGWTADRAASMGKPVDRVTIGPEGIQPY